MDDYQLQPPKHQELDQELVRAWGESSVELPAEDYARLVRQAGVITAAPAKDMRNGYFRLSGDNYIRLVTRATTSLQLKD